MKIIMHLNKLILALLLVLVGSVENKIPDIALLPIAIAKCSLEYFIGNSLN
jgi:hypothetical protein